MAYFQVYAALEEVAALISELAVWRGLTGCYATKSLYLPFDARRAHDRLDILKSGHYVFLFPGEYSANWSIRCDSVAPKYAGWIHVQPGGYIEHDGKRELIESTFVSGKSTDGMVRGDLHVEGLKRRLVKRWRFGVGWNPADGVDNPHIYMNVGYSDTALRLFQEGVRWCASANSWYSMRPAEPEHSK